MKAGRPSFRPELINSSSQKLDFELALKLEMTETQQMEMKAEGQMENHLIIQLAEKGLKITYIFIHSTIKLSLFSLICLFNSN